MGRHFLLFFVAGAASLLGGCYAGVRAQPAYVGPAGGVVVYQAPPPPRVIARPAAPFAGAVWVNGYWGWTGRRYAWNRGHWVRPRAGYVYAQPSWVRRGNGWVHQPGRWRRGQGVVVNRRGPRRPVVVTQPGPRRVVVDPGPTRGDVRRARRQGRRQGRQQMRRQIRRENRRDVRRNVRQSGGVRVVPGRVDRRSNGNRPTVEVRKHWKEKS